MKKTELTVRPLSGIDLSGVPEVIRVLPKGHVSSTKGDFEVDDRDIAGIIRQFKARRLDLVIDYEHQTLSDVQAPAAGWIKDLYPGEDALMARVEWTKKGGSISPTRNTATCPRWYWLKRQTSTRRCSTARR